MCHIVRVHDAPTTVPLLDVPILSTASSDR